MSRQPEGTIKKTHRELVELADKLYKKYKESNIILLKELTLEEEIPFEMFSDVFCEDFYFRQKWSLMMDMQEVRYTQAVIDKKIPPTFGIFQTKQKHIANYADKSDKSGQGKKTEVVSRQSVKNAIRETKDKLFPKSR